MGLNIKDLREIVDFLEQRGIAEFELDEDGRRVRIVRGHVAAPVQHLTAPQPVTAAAPAPILVAPPAPAAPAAAPEPPVDQILVKSPIVGTFYRSPDANAAAFVNVGDVVKPGQVLCIIEAMKLMNEIESEESGEIVKVFPQNGQPVQFGEPLFALKRA
jgi:acetyl-CoA carboxylase biotin carboxyl carrier protein